ncbi:MAG: hypothetical protein R3C24_01490 [Cyanobacteriota/Melainabacteria group bacterium]
MASLPVSILDEPDMTTAPGQDNAIKYGSSPASSQLTKISVPSLTTT